MSQYLINKYRENVSYAAQNNLYQQGVQKHTPCGSDIAQRWAARATAPGTAEKWWRNYSRAMAGGGGAAPPTASRY